MRTTSAVHLSRRTALTLAGAGGIALGANACGSSSSTETSSDEILFYNQSRGQEAVLTSLAEEYSQANGITLRIETPGPADYQAKLQSKAQSGQMPDIYSALEFDQMAAYYKAGWAMDLSEEMADGWRDSFTPLLPPLTELTDDNPYSVPAGIYSAHWDMNANGLFVNPELSGIDLADPPSTMEELIRVLGEASPDHGLFSMSASLTPNMLVQLGSNYLDDEEIESTLTGRTAWTSDAWARALSVFEKLRDGGVVASGSLPGGSDDNPEVEKSFFNVQDIGTMYNGSATVAVARSTAPEFTAFGSLGLPPVEDAEFPSRLCARPGRGAAVNPKGKDPDAALAFVRWLTEPEQQARFSEEAGCTPTNAEILTNGGTAEQLDGIVATLDSALAVPSVVTTDVRGAIGAAAQSLVLGEVSVDQALESIQVAQERSA